MDSEHRHELKSNDLATFLTRLPDYLKENTNVVIGVGLILIGLVTWPLFNKMSQSKTVAEQSRVSDAIQQLSASIGGALKAPEDAQALDAVLLGAQTLMDETQHTDNPNLAALAYIKAGQAFRTELHLRPQQVSVETIDAQVQKAQDAYTTALKKAKTPTIQGMAELGLGLCAEERGQAQQAREIYQGIVDNAAYAATVLPAQAQMRLDALADSAETFTFTEAAAALEEMTIEELNTAIKATQQDIAETQKQLEAAAQDGDEN